MTDEVYPESVNGDADLDDYNRLVAQQKQKLRILSEQDDQSVADSTASDAPARIMKQSEGKSDEFLRNFFIKFGMKRTLESF